jgi:hypothetical protein
MGWRKICKLHRESPELRQSLDGVIIRRPVEFRLKALTELYRLAFRFLDKTWMLKFYGQLCLEILFKNVITPSISGYIGTDLPVGRRPASEREQIAV